MNFYFAGGKLWGKLIEVKGDNYDFLYFLISAAFSNIWGNFKREI